MEAVVESMNKMVAQMVDVNEGDETLQSRVDYLFKAMDTVSSVLCNIIYCVVNFI